MKSFDTWLKETIHPNEEELAIIHEITETRHLKANEIIVKQGSVSNNIGLLVQGAVRIYFTDSDGNEKMVNFAFEGQPLIVFDSFFSEVPSAITAVTLEPCIIVGTDKARYLQFVNQFPKYNSLLITFISNWFADGKNRMEYLHKGTAKEKYEMMCRIHPQINERVPLKYIASYLGIT